MKLKRDSEKIESARFNSISHGNQETGIISNYSLTTIDSTRAIHTTYRVGPNGKNVKTVEIIRGNERTDRRTYLMEENDYKKASDLICKIKEKLDSYVNPH